MQTKLKVGIIVLIISCIFINNMFKKRDDQLINLDTQKIQCLQKGINELVDNKINSETRGSLFYQGNNVKTFYHYIILGYSKTEIYVWMARADYYEEITIKGGHYKETNILSQNVAKLPIVFKYKQKNDTIKVINYFHPRDGEDSGKDRMKMFPPEIRKKFKNYEGGIDLKVNLDKKAYKYYQK